MKDDVAPLESLDESANDAVTGVRATEGVHEIEAPTEEIEIDSVELGLVQALDTTEELPRRTTAPPPPPAAALQTRRLSSVPSIPQAADLKARLRAPTPFEQRATAGPIGSPPMAAGSRASDIELLTTSVERLNKRLAERDAYLAELENAHGQRLEALRAAESRIAVLEAELDVRTDRIGELEAKLAARASLHAQRTAAARDDLTQIRGIGPHYARLLEGMGVGSFAAIAAWSVDDCGDFARRLKVNPTRVERDRWVEQARALSAAARVTPAEEL